MFNRLARRINKSFAYRSGSLCREILRILPEPRLKKKDLLGIPLVTMTGRDHLLMLEQTLFTIAVHWKLIPNVVAVSDGSLSLSQIQEKLSWWPAGLDVMEWQELRDFHKEKGRFELAEYAEKHIFGRKLCVTLAMAEKTRVLWCDCDILFFSDFSALIDTRPHDGPLLHTAEDGIYSYDERLMKGKLEHLYSRPPVNAGLVLCEGNLYDSCALRGLINDGMLHCMDFTEQTIIAEAAFQVGSIAWNIEMIRMFDDDELTIRPTYLGKNWVARHYVFPIRHLFWHDALAVRLGVGRSR